MITKVIADQIEQCQIMWIEELKLTPDSLQTRIKLKEISDIAPIKVVKTQGVFKTIKCIVELTVEIDVVGDMS